jgi:trans-2,3-dihydro-3-hydroxyanthranilate isomerase
MRSFRFYTTDVFTSSRFGGNQLAVFPDATGLDPALYQTIAREFNFSETTFVLRNDVRAPAIRSEAHPEGEDLHSRR